MLEAWQRGGPADGWLTLLAIPPPPFLLTVAPKGLSVLLSALESMLAEDRASVDSKELGTKHRISLDVVSRRRGCRLSAERPCTRCPLGDTSHTR
jgi:hypothetical protein